MCSLRSVHTRKERKFGESDAGVESEDEEEWVLALVADVEGGEVGAEALHRVVDGDARRLLGYLLEPPLEHVGREGHLHRLARRLRVRGAGAYACWGRLGLPLPRVHSDRRRQEHASHTQQRLLHAVVGGMSRRHRALVPDEQYRQKVQRLALQVVRRRFEGERRKGALAVHQGAEAVALKTVITQHAVHNVYGHRSQHDRSV
eukprot:6210270-Pleurochrysis_carterae.AAC.5